MTDTPPAVRVVPTMHDYRPAHLVICLCGVRFVYHDREEALSAARLHAGDCGGTPRSPRRPTTFTRNPFL